MTDMFYPVQVVSDYFSYSVLGLKKETILGESVNFFIYDSVKILLLLFVIIFAVTFIRTYLSPEKIKKVLHQKYSFFGHVLAALIGIVTPFCSCSAVPLFIGFVESGVPLGVTFSYLVAAPMINEVAAVLLFGLFGWKIMLLYIGSGIVIAVTTGAIIGKLKLEKQVEEYVWRIKVGKSTQTNMPTFNMRVSESFASTILLIKKVYPYVLLGVAIGALIHGYIPSNLIQTIGKYNIFSVPLAVLLGVPLYSNAAGVIPIIKPLIDKGLPIGTALSFMMAVTALSLPEMIILRRVLKPKLLGVYIVILTVGIIFTGYLFNWVL